MLSAEDMNSLENGENAWHLSCDKKKSVASAIVLFGKICQVKMGLQKRILSSLFVQSSLCSVGSVGEDPGTHWSLEENLKHDIHYYYY